MRPSRILHWSILICAGAAPASAQDRWVEVGWSAKREMIVTMDRETLVVSGNRVEAWLTATYPTAARTEAGGSYHHKLTRVGIDCASRQYRFFQTTYYDRDNRVLSEDDGTPEWETPVPRSVIDFVIGTICTGLNLPRGK
jgi:hypothetical protein